MSLRRTSEDLNFLSFFIETKSWQKQFRSDSNKLVDFKDINKEFLPQKILPKNPLKIFKKNQKNSQKKSRKNAKNIQNNFSKSS